MARFHDSRLDESKAIPLRDVISRLRIEGLRKNGQELTGPCPRPGCGGDDRFSINTRTLKFLCRRCGIKGGDQVGLVSEVLGLDFKEALTWLCGDAVVEIDPAERARRVAKAEADEKERQAEAERYRQKAIADARVIWRNGEPPTSPILRRYLERRGFGSTLIKSLPPSLRFIGDHPYVKTVAGSLETLHRGPCMIARIDNATEDCVAVHQTWIDLDQPKGKARITRLMEHNKGKPWPAKMVRGSKKGGVIRLSKGRGHPMIMAEGIETTLSACEASVFPRAVYWAGVDLGNMAGKMRAVPGVRHSGEPDMSDNRAFVPPDWVKHLIFIQDGDSAQKMTRAKLECGLRRAMAHRPGLRAQIVHAGDGVDLNDLIRPGVEEDGHCRRGLRHDG